MRARRRAAAEETGAHLRRDGATAEPGVSAARPRSVGVLLVRLGAAIIGLATLFSWWASPDRLASLPWSLIALAGIVLVLFVTGRRLPTIARRMQPRYFMWFFLAGGFVALLSALLTSRWPTYKLSWLGSVYAALPSVRSFSWGGQGLQPNQTGGFLAVCTVFAAVIAAWPSLSRRRRWPGFALALAGTVVVFMTGSRAALAGLLLVFLTILVVRTRRRWWAWTGAVAVAVSGLSIAGQWPRLLSFFLADEGLDTKIASRLDIWSSALRGIQDHFFTGIGLGVFNQVIPARYPYHIVGMEFSVSQAHNLFLDVTLAIGFPGLVGFVLFLAGSLILAAKWVRGRGTGAPVAMAILSGFAVYLVFGITDSISLSVPTSFIIWLWSISLVLLHESTIAYAPLRHS